MTFDDIDPFAIDEGQESEPTVNDVTEPAVAEPVAETDSADEAAADVSTADKGAETPVEGEKVSEEPKAEEDEGEKSLDETLKEVEKEIANDKHPKWFRASLQGVKAAFLKETEAVTSRFAPLADYGEVDKIVEQLEIVKGLEAFETNPATGLPERTVKPFVESLVKTRGIETGVAVVREMLNLPSPQNEGWTLQHEMFAANGLDPNRIPDLKRFAENGYQFGTTENPPPPPEDLALVPENLREAFISLSPDKRDELLLLSPETMEIALGGVQNKLDQERTAKEQELTKAETEAKEKVEKEQQFVRDVQTRSAELLDESGGKLFNSFTETLVKADIDKFDAIAIANTLSMTLNNGGIESKATRDALAEIGVKLDPAIDTLFGEWLTIAQQAAAFEKSGDKANYAIAFNRFGELEGQLIRKAAPIVKGIVEHRAKSAATRVEQRNSLLDKTKAGNNGLAASAGSPRAIATTGNGRRIPTDEEFDQMNAFE